MTWSTPRTWETNELVTAANMNTYISDNLSHLMSGVGGDAKYSTAYGTTNYTAFTAINSANLDITLTVGRTRVLVFFSANIQATSQIGYVTVSNGSTDLGNMITLAASAYMYAAVMGVFTGLTIGTSYTFSPQWKTAASGGTFTMRSPYMVSFAAMEV